MNKYLTTHNAATDTIEVFAESEDYVEAQNLADEWVWQYANDKLAALSQHFDKHDEWTKNPTKAVY